MKKTATKKSAAKKAPAKKTPAKKTPTKKTPAKKAPAKKIAAKKAPAKKTATNRAEPLEVEKEAASLLDDYDNGEIDNAFDVLEKLLDIDRRLPKESSLRKDFDEMFQEIETICREG